MHYHGVIRQVDATSSNAMKWNGMTRLFFIE